MSVRSIDPSATLTTRRSTLAGLAAAAAAPIGHAAQQVGESSEYNQRAIALIHDWANALIAKDAEKAASYLDENCQYRDDPFQTTLKQGRAQALADIKILLRGLTAMKFEAEYAVGSPKEVLVLVRRVDTFTLNGKSISTPMGAYFRVRDGKILEWVDTPLAEMPPPPKK
jgi:limonene-1,2-epoxide hydrolase